MKRILLLLLSVLSYITTSYGAVIGRDKAIDTAKTFMTQQLPYFDTSVMSVELYEEDNTAYFYIINFVKGGWTLISSSNLIKPVIGYAPTGNFSMSQQLPDNFTGWFHTYKAEIKAAISSPETTKEHREWNSITTRTTRSAGDKVAPLISVKWNQSAPYNKYCPSDNNGRAIVGCVAVAMAQAMTVYQYPTKPIGKYQYVSATYGWITVDYDKEEPYDWNAIMTGANNRDEVARLLYHCGVAVNMNYGVSASGTQSQYIARALRDHFGFAPSVTHHTRASYTGDWKQLIINELQSGRPVCYNGADLARGYGHCFNIDGYDGNNMFHVNWGWGGSNDGYFPLDALRDVTMGMDYTAQQGAIVGMIPPSDAPINITLSNTIVKERQPAGTVVGEISVQSYATNPTYEFEITSEYDDETGAFSEIPFKIDNSKLITTKELLNSDGDYDILITATNVDNAMSLTQAFTITVSAGIPLTSAITLTYDKATKQLTIATKEKVLYTIYSGDDENVVTSGELASDTQVMLNTEEWSGSNTIKFSNASGNKALKLKF